MIIYPKSNRRIVCSMDPEEVFFRVQTANSGEYRHNDRNINFKVLQYLVRANSARYEVFRLRDHCVECGLVASICFLEASQPEVPKNNMVLRAHFNFYGLRDNKYVLMTKDHVVAKSRGGANEISNYITMCERCNCRKGSKPAGYKLDGNAGPDMLNGQL